MQVTRQWDKEHLNRSVAGLSRSQLREHAPTEQGPGLEKVLDRFSGASAGVVLKEAREVPTSTPVTKVARAAGATSVILGGLAMAAGVARGMLGGTGGWATAGLGLAGAGLGFLAGWAADKGEESLRNRSLETQKTVILAAEGAARDLVKESNGQITDQLFFEAGAFANPTEVRQAGSGEVLARQVSIQGPAPASLKEDATRNEVTLQWPGGEARFPGHLELPTAERPVASVVHCAGGDNPEKLQDTRIEFGVDGQVRLGAVSKHYWDDAGFGYDNKAYLGGPPEGRAQLNEDGSAYFQGDWDRDWYALQAPAGLLEQPATGDSSRVSMESRRSENLKLTYGVSHGPLQGVKLEPVTLTERPIGASLHEGRVDVQVTGGDVEVRHGQEVRRFRGSLDAEGVLSVESPVGALSQDLCSRSVDLTLAHPSGTFRVSHSGDHVSVYQQGAHRREPTVEVTAAGNYQVTWDGGTLSIETPVPHHWGK